jgi:methyl-accepting chemotaxis protein
VAAHIYEARTAPTVDLMKAVDALHRARQIVLIALSEENEKSAQAQLGKMAPLDEAMKSALKAYIAAAPEQKEAIGRLESLVAEYNKARDQSVKMIEVGDLSSALENVKANAGPKFDKVLIALSEVMQAQAESAHSDYEQAAYRLKTEGTIQVVLALLTLCGIGLMFYFIGSGIMRQLRDAAVAARRVADGDLTVKVEVKRKDEIGQLLQALSDMVNGLKKLTGEVVAGAHGVAGNSAEIAQSTHDLSQRTEEQASTLEETASSMEELTSTVLQNAENAKQANQLAAGASDVAVKGGKVIGKVVDTMSSINQSSKKITDIISVIDGIAFQTNILALNAAVEAARAGEQGRGFAVVAAEVRTLAQRSAAAAKEIKQLIGASVHEVESGTRLVDEAGKTMEQIVASVKRVTAIMSEIAAASQEQSVGIGEVNLAITQMDQTTQQNAALVEEASAAAESMNEKAQQLVQAVAMFKLDESVPRPVETVKFARFEESRPQAVVALANKALGTRGPDAQNEPRERHLRVAPAPRRAFAAHGAALTEAPESDHWTEL